MNEYQKIYDAIIEGDEDKALEEAKTLLAQGVPPIDIINQGLITAMEEIGRLYKEEEIFIPEMMMAAQAVTEVINTLKPHMPAGSGSRGAIVIGTVEGDIHDIGKNIVKVLLENYAYQVLDLGKDVPPEVIVDTAIKEDVPVVGLSALMTTTVVSMEETIKQLREKKPGTKVVVGGAVLTQEYADSIGADCYAKDAMATVHYADSVFGV